MYDEKQEARPGTETCEHLQEKKNQKSKDKTTTKIKNQVHHIILEREEKLFHCQMFRGKVDTEEKVHRFLSRMFWFTFQVVCVQA